jgi:ATP-dependent Clp protease ATP-binding subunit ClpC
VIERFSTNSRAALAAAEREARALGHAHVATEHVLLGLLRVEESVAAQALRALGVTHRKARRRIVRLVDVGPQRVAGPIQFTPRVREVLEDAFTGSIWLPRLGERLVGRSFRPPHGTNAPRFTRCPAGPAVRTEALLLALVAHEEGVAAHVLAGFGVDVEKAAAATTAIRFPLPVGPWSLGPWPPKAL